MSDDPVSRQPIDPLRLATERLIFVRHLYDLGIQHLSGPYPAAAILCFHDAMETFLQIGVEYRQAKLGSKDEIMTLFKNLKEQVPDLEGETWLLKLNEARITVKHKALDVSRDEAERCRSRTQSLLEINSQKIFETEFFSISRSAAITDEHIRSKIQEAEAALLEGNLAESLKVAAQAFATLRRTCKTLSSGKVTQKNEELTGDIIATFLDLETKVNLISIGISYNRYRKFLELSPAVATAVSGKQTVASRRANFTVQEARYCIEFVIDVALASEQYERQFAKA